MKKKLFVLFLAALMLLVLACKPTENVTPEEQKETEVPATAVPATEAPATAEPVVEVGNDIVVLFTNDTHCGVSDGIGFVGVARLKAALQAAGKNVILVDCGDAVQGDIIGTLSKGEAIIGLMNAVGYDVATLGNHEFDYGMDQFNKNVELAQFKYVSCNFTDKDGKPLFDAYTIIEIAGKKVAFVGVATPQTFTSSTPTYFMDEEHNFIYSFCEGNNGQDLYDAVQKAVDAARAEGADYVIALTHLGIDSASLPWTASNVIENTTGIDVVLDGHSHSVINGISVKNKDGNTVIHAQTGTKFANVGMLTISEDGAISEKLINVSAMALMDDLGLLAEDYGVGEAVAAAIAQNEELVNTVVAHTDVDLVVNDPVVTDVRIVRSQETNLGDLCADAYRAMGEADIAFVNGGGVRAKIEAGDITFGQIIKVHPFGNSMCVVEATGQEVLDALEFSVSKLPGEFGGFLQVSGLKFDVDVTIPSPVVLSGTLFASVEGERRVKNVEVLQADGTYAPIDPEKIYTVACHNYLLKDMGDGYTMFADNKLLRDEVMIDNQVLINYIVDVLNGTVGSEYVDPYGQGRITIEQ